MTKNEKEKSRAQLNHLSTKSERKLIGYKAIASVTNQLSFRAYAYL